MTQDLAMAGMSDFNIAEMTRAGNVRARAEAHRRGLACARFDPTRMWHSVEQVPYSTMGYGGGTALRDKDGADIGYVVTLNKSRHHDPKALDAAIHRCIKDRTAAIAWANQSVDMLKDAFFPVADALRALEAYLQNTPHHNAPETAAARKALRVFDAQGDTP